MLLAFAFDLFTDFLVFLADIAPNLESNLIERVHRPLHDMEGINTSLGLGNVLGDAVVNPSGTVTADKQNTGSLFGG